MAPNCVMKPSTVGTLTELELILQQMAEIDHAKDAQAREAALNCLLERIGRYTKADRAYIFEYDNVKALFSNTEEWCAEGVTPQMNGLQGVYPGDMPHWFVAFKEGKSIILQDLEAVAAVMPGEYAMLKAQDVHAVIAFPIFHGGRLLGFFGIDNPMVEASRQLINLLEVVGGHLGNLLLLKQTEQTMTADEQERIKRDRLLLEILNQEYVAVYYLDLNSGLVDVVKVNLSLNASGFFPKNHRTGIPYENLLHAYAAKYVVNGDELVRAMGIEHLKSVMRHQARSSFRYRAVPNSVGQEYFEMRTFCVRCNENEFRVLLGVRCIDSLLKTERERQLTLERALEDSRRKNSIISAIAKIYCTILQVDLADDHYADIARDHEHNYSVRGRGRAGAWFEKFGEHVTEEYAEAVGLFVNLKTLPERLRDTETLSIEYRGKDGNWYHARFVVKMRDEAGDVVRVLFLVRVINEAKRREQNLLVLAKAASNANEAKTEFLSRIAHDIRTPMNVVLGYTDLIRAHVNEPDMVRKGVERLSMASRYLLQLVNDVLDLTRIEKGQMILVPEKTNILQAFKVFTSTAEGMMQQKGLHFVTKIDRITSEWILMDSLHMRQIFVHLLSNAVKYTPEGGTVRFLLHQEAAEKPENVRLVVEVSDTGIGMTPEFMKQMYNRFSRAVDTRVNRERGSGLGLSVVKELVDLFHGRIEAKSEVGKGTCFQLVFEFPRVEQGRQEQRTPQNVDQLCRGMHLLVAEDNDLNYEVESSLLAMQGITCERAENGAVCVEKFNASLPGRYDAILMDMQMPLVNGIEATRLLRQLGTPYAMTIPIIAVTANAFNDDVKNCIDAGMNMHLSKPIDIEKLKTMLAEFRVKRYAGVVK